MAGKKVFIEASFLTREAKTVYSPGNNGEHYWPFDLPENSELAPKTKHKILSFFGHKYLKNISTQN